LRYCIAPTLGRTLLYDANLLLAMVAAILGVVNSTALDNLKVFVGVVATCAPFFPAARVFSLI
jgi:hypothetical protein